MFILLELVFAFLWVVLAVAVYEVEGGSGKPGEDEDPKAAAEAKEWLSIRTTGEAMGLQVFAKPEEDDDSEWGRAVRRSRDNLTAFFEDGPQMAPEVRSGMDRALELLATANPNDYHREGRVRVLLGCYYGCSPLEFDPEDVSTLTPKDVVANLLSDRWWGFKEEAAIEVCCNCGLQHSPEPCRMPQPPLHYPRISLPREGVHHFEREEGAEQGVWKSGGPVRDDAKRPPESCWKCGGPHPAAPCRVPDLAPELQRKPRKTEEEIEEAHRVYQASWDHYLDNFPSDDYSDSDYDDDEPMTEEERKQYDWC